jgi:hypothetical protein
MKIQKRQLEHFLKRESRFLKEGKIIFFRVKTGFSTQFFNPAFQPKGGSKHDI